MMNLNLTGWKKEPGNWKENLKKTKKKTQMMIKIMVNGTENNAKGACQVKWKYFAKYANTAKTKGEIL